MNRSDERVWPPMTLMSQEANRAMEALTTNGDTSSFPFSSCCQDQRPRISQTTLNIESNEKTADSNIILTTAGQEWHQSSIDGISPIDRKRCSGCLTRDMSAVAAGRSNSLSTHSTLSNNSKLSKEPFLQQECGRATGKDPETRTQNIRSLRTGRNKLPDVVPSATRCIRPSLSNGFEPEKPFRISAVGYDRRYEDMIAEAARSDDDGLLTEIRAEAVKKCSAWLRKQNSHSLLIGKHH